MNYEEWEPYYKEIIDDFGYLEEKDIKSAKILAEIQSSDNLTPLREIKGKIVEITGPFIERIENDFIIAAGSSISEIHSLNERPSLMVTDLDGDIELQLDYNLKGVPIVIHAHGDNISTIKKWAPKFQGHVILTCQCEPFPEMYNFGGFTDGDRAVFLADHFGAKKIILNGWDFDRPSPKDVDKEIKKKKLIWAKKLISIVKKRTPIEII